MEISRRDFDQLVKAVAGLCDSCKRLEWAAETGDSSYVAEAKAKRVAAERAIERIGTGVVVINVAEAPEASPLDVMRAHGAWCQR